jgi:enterobactin synthetase component D
MSENPEQVLYSKPPFSIPGVHLFACSYDEHQVNLNHPPLSKILIPPSLSNALHKRKTEYALGRFCAKMALCEMGISGIVERHPDRSPSWPQSVVGSITHTRGFSMAGVGSEKKWRGIGIDSEALTRDIPIEDCAKQFISSDELNLRTEMTQKQWMYTVFSTKESVFKALHPFVKRFFGFFAVSVIDIQHIDSMSGSLLIRLDESLGPFDSGFFLNCSFSLTHSHIHTLVLLM